MGGKTACTNWPSGLGGRLQSRCNTDFPDKICSWTPTAVRSAVSRLRRGGKRSPTLLRCYLLQRKVISATGKLTSVDEDFDQEAKKVKN